MKLKSFIKVLFFLLFSFKGFSQTKKGNIGISGKTDLNFLVSNTAMSIDSTETRSIKNNQYGFTIGLGYFIADNLSIVVSGAYSYSYTRIPTFNYQRGMNENITTALAVVPGLSYYFPLEGKLKPSLTIGAGYLWLRERDSKVTSNHNIVYSLAGPSFNGGVGLSYFINKSVAFDLGLQHTYNKLKDKSQNSEIQKQNAVAGAFGVSVFL